MFKIGEIYIRDNASTINVDGIIPTPLCFMLSGSVIQAVYVFRLITTVGIFQAPLPIIRLIAAILEEETRKAATCFINIRQLSLSYSNAIRASRPTLISPPSSLTSLNWLIV